MLNAYAPKISIIIGVLNMNKYLPIALDSVVRQNYPNLELIVMDGGSTDGTLDVIKAYESHITYWQTGKDNGHADACNKALERSTGDLINLLNADDILGDNLLNNVAAMYQRRPTSKVITCGVQIIELNNQTQQSRVLKDISKTEQLELSLHNILFELPVINARFFHKSIFQQFGKFQATHADGSYNLSNDRDFLITMALAGVQSEVIPESFYYYLSHNESLTFSGKHLLKSYNEHLKLADKFLQLITLQPKQRYLLKNWQAQERVYLFLNYLLRMNLPAGWRTFRTGLSYNHLFRIGTKILTRKIKRLIGQYKTIARFLKKNLMPVN